jgi:hypothetical protein
MNAEGQRPFGVGLNVEDGELQALSGGDDCRSIFDTKPRSLGKIWTRGLAEDEQGRDWDRFWLG